MYSLYHNKQTLELKIEPWNYGKPYSTNDIKYWNDNCYRCNEIKPLRKKAEEIKLEWINDFKNKIELLENSKLKVKYK